MPVFSNNAGGGGLPPEPGILFNNEPGAVSLGDAVYILPPPASPNTVARACAGAPPLRTPDAIGIVIATPTPTMCRVISHGIATLSPPLPQFEQGATYYVGTEPAPAPPLTSTAPGGGGEKQQKVGVAASMTQLYICISSTSVIV